MQEYLLQPAADSASSTLGETVLLLQAWDYHIEGFPAVIAVLQLLSCFEAPSCPPLVSNLMGSWQKAEQ